MFLVVRWYLVCCRQVSEVVQRKESEAVGYAKMQMVWGKFDASWRRLVPVIGSNLFFSIRKSDPFASCRYSSQESDSNSRVRVTLKVSHFYPVSQAKYLKMYAYTKLFMSHKILFLGSSIAHKCWNKNLQRPKDLSCVVQCDEFIKIVFKLSHCDPKKKQSYQNVF